MNEMCQGSQPGRWRRRTWPPPSAAAQVATAPRAKRLFRITQAGRAAFAEWVKRQPPLEQIRYPLLLTVSFGAWLGPERLLEFVHAHRAAHEAKLAGYRDLISAPGLDGYVRATVAFGIHYEEAVLAWMADLPAILAESGR